jgi:hypothetical protein
MPDRSSPTVAALLLVLVAALLAPGAALAAPRPGESCPDTTPAPGATLGPGSTETVCGEGKATDGGAGGSLDLGGILPFVAAAAGGALIALAAAFVVLRRRAAAPAAPADPGEWWTCRKCGRNNVIGSPRCYACGEWQG